MSKRPKLSICVPSRNRQDCFRQTVADLLADPRSELEFVLADNSDDPGIVNRFMSDLADPRVRYLPSADRPLSMADNWERTLLAATGDWVIFIGDDDYVDPGIVDHIGEIEARDPSVEAIGWNRVPFQWVAARSETKSVAFSLINRVMRHTKEQIERRLFGWAAATYMPQCPYGIYHAAVPRRMLDRIAATFSGRFFEHPTVDSDFTHKLVSIAENFIYINRPMSILGVAPTSNSAAVGDSAGARRAVAAYRSEYGDTFERVTLEAGFPFRADTGVAGNVMAAQVWFKQRYGIRHDGWQENFARAAAHECGLWRDRPAYESQVDLLTRAFRAWDGGRYLPFFTPRFVGAIQGPTFWGLRDNHLYVNQEIAGASTPGAFYRVLQDILPARQDMEAVL